MTFLVITLIIILLAVISVQFGRVTELAASIRGEEEVALQKNNRTAMFSLLFMIVFLVLCVVSAIYYKNSMLGYGPHESASEHGFKLDGLFNVTLFFTGIVFILTHIALFWYTWKYRAKRGRKALFFPHDNTLEYVWTIIPALVMTFLVVKGLVVWNEVMPDVGPDDEYMEIEATGYQFAWDLRYPGDDGKLGTKVYTEINPATNPLGQVWTDEKNHDDFMADKLVLPVDQKVRVRITAKDVLHNFYLPHFRVKMDAIPGLPTYFIFTPTKTTAEYREGLRAYPEWNELADPDDAESGPKWKSFNYELACAELCGDGHYSMQRLVEVVTRDEYNAWLAEQKSYYLSNIRNTDADPFKGKLINAEIKDRSKNFKSKVEAAISAENEADKIIRLKYVKFKSGSAELTDDSKYELDNLMQVLALYPNMKIELGGHTDNVGNPSSNLTLSQQRADSVLAYLKKNGINLARLSGIGYGQTRPVESNDTAEGRQNNRRTEFKIISQ